MSTTSSTAFPLGYFGANPNGNDPTAEQTFQAQYDAFVQAMGGAHPLFMNAFTDFSLDPSEWGANAGWTAWSWAQSGNKYVAPGSGTTPVIGVPMASNAGGWSNVDQFYQGIISGKYDADYKAVVDAWAGQGYKTIDLRLGYEFNGNFMAWAPSNSASSNANADFVKAWQHLADLVHAAGKADGITVNTVWNPNVTNWAATPVAGLYPGDQYVDIISADAYSPVYPRDLTMWANGGTTRAADITQWASQAANRVHYWQNPDANAYHPSGEGSGWSVKDTVAFAKAHGKPISLSETGAGGNGSTTGPVDDPAFPQWLSGALQAAQSQGVSVSYVDIWDAPLSDGNWDFSDPGSKKPLEAAAWDKYFGAGSGGGTGSDTVGQNSATGGGSNGGTGNDTVAQGGGPDTVIAQPTGGVYFGGTGLLTFLGGVSLDSTVVAGQGNAVLYGASNGNGLFFVGPGQFILDGGSGDQTVIGTAGASNSAVLFSQNGGSLTLFGNSDNNLLVAGSGNATLNAGGASGDNVLFAGSGDDSVVAGSGNNVIVGGPGSDTLIGGAGVNLFEVNRTIAAGGSDLIGDWTVNDQLYLVGYGAATAPGGLPAGATTAVVNGSEILTLTDGTRITFLGVSSASTAQFHSS